MGFFDCFRDHYLMISCTGKNLPSITLDGTVTSTGEAISINPDILVGVENRDGIPCFMFIGLCELLVVPDRVWVDLRSEEDCTEFSKLSQHDQNLCLSILNQNCDKGNHTGRDKIDGRDTSYDPFYEQFSLEEVRLAISDLRLSGSLLDLSLKQGHEKEIRFDYVACDCLRLKTLREAYRILSCDGVAELEGDIKWLRRQVCLQAQKHAEFAVVSSWILSSVPSRHQYIWLSNGLRYFNDDSKRLREGLEHGVESFLVKGEYSIVADPRRRKVLYCDDAWANVEKIDDLDDSFTLMSPEAVEIYNSKVKASDKLIFQVGHPQKGCTYLQHPFKPNIYYEVNTFHDNLRERKQAELLRILESIGAYSATVEVFHEQGTSRDVAASTADDMSGRVGAIEGRVSSSDDIRQSESIKVSQKSNLKWTFNPPKKPELPSDLCFYPTEETWQQLVKSVKRGGLKTAVVDLEYHSEYGMTFNYLSKCASELKAAFCAYNMNLSSKFEENLHRLTTTTWHYEVVFEDGNGKRAGARAGKVASKSGGAENRGEALFIKRLRRYVASEGHVNAEQRADLEQLAQKCGIDELRMEELIEEAFE